MDETFIQLFTKQQRGLYLHILTQVGNVSDAEEILQETNVVILSKSDKFQLGTNFKAWTCQIATFEILKFYQQQKRDKLRFSPEFVDVVSKVSEESLEFVEQRRKALEICLGKLREQDRDLIRHRYQPSVSGQETAESLGRPSNSVYQSLGRIRRMLWECMKRQLALQ